MDWKEYKFVSKWEPKLNTVIKGAFVESILKHKGKEFLQVAMIDSGAYISMLDESIMEVLGIDKSKCVIYEVGGIVGEMINGYLYKLEIKIEKFDFFIELPVVFVPQLKTGMLLGQKEFFEKFRIKFDGSEDTFFLNSVDETNNNMEGIEDSGSAFAIK